MKTITVKDETWQRIRDLAAYGDTMDSVISRGIRCLESKEQK